MNELSFLAEVRHSNRLLQLRDQLRREYSPVEAKLWPMRLFFVWGLFPLVAVLPWGITLLLFPLVLLGFLKGFPPLALTTFDALRYPSRRALYVARLVRSLVWLFWLGAWGTFGVWRQAQLMADPSWFTPALAVTLVLVPWATVAICGAWYIGLRTRSMFIPFMFFVVLFNVSILTPPLLQGIAAVPGWLWPALLALLTAGLFAFQVWALERMEPARQVLLAEDKPIQAGAAPANWGHTTTSGRLGPAWLLQGQPGLGRILAYLGLARARVYWKRLFSSDSVWLYALSLMILGDIIKEGRFFFHLSFWLWWLLFIALVTPPLLEPHHPQRLYLLGVDYRRQLLHRLATYWLATPLLFAVILMAVVVVGTGHVVEALTFLAMTFAVQTFRAGWYEWPSLQAGPGVGRGALLMFALLALLLVLFVPDRMFLAPWPWSPAVSGLTFAAATLVVGLVGLTYKFVRLDELTLREALRG